jgi:hypothetical protein
MACGRKHLKIIRIRNLTVEQVDHVMYNHKRTSMIFQGPSSIGMDINFLNFEHVYGIPEHADSFALRSTQ